MATIEEKNGHVAANAEARVEDENGGQDHCYSENESGSKPLPGESEHKGEAAARSVKANSTATAGLHIVSKKGGLQVAAERKNANETARTEHQKSWDSNRKSVVPERKGKK